MNISVFPRFPGRKAIVHIGCAAVLGLALASCQSTKKEETPKGPGTVKVRVSASKGVNPNDAGRASPIAVSVFVLNGTGTFQQADYFQLTDNAAATLGSSLAGSDSVFLRPGESKQITLNTPGEQSNIGIVAGYQDIDAATWRATVAIGHEDTVDVSVGSSSVSARKIQQTGG